MSSHSKHGIASHWRSVISETVACVSCWSAVSSATAQESASPSLIAFLSVSTIPAESIRSNSSERVDHQALTERDGPRILMPHRKPTDTEAWEKFESDFRPEQRSPMLVKREIETAKYGLDVTVFAVDRFVKSIRDHADFEFDQGRLRRAPANPLRKSLGNPRVKLDLEMWQGSKPYVGARVVIPFGN